MQLREKSSLAAPRTRARFSAEQLHRWLWVRRTELKAGLAQRCAVGDVHFRPTSVTFTCRCWEADASGVPPVRR